MPIVKWFSSRPSIQILGAVVALSAACGSGDKGADAKGKKSDGKADAKADGKADAKADGKADTKADTKAGAPDKVADAPPAGVCEKNAGKVDCCFYCSAGQVPCGKSCLDEGAECKEEKTCACGAEDRPRKKFKQFAVEPKGIIRDDVACYNHAQGDPFWEKGFTLADAFEGDAALADKSKGKLHAVIKTDKGDVECELYEDKTPLTVANFVGLARGTRPTLDRKSKEWSKKKYYDDVLFHRVIPDFMVQTGDPAGTGTGTPGYFIPDEFDPELRHDSPGLLSMANRNRVDRATQKLITDVKTGQLFGNTGSGQFFITVAGKKRVGYLDDRHTVFGKCGDPKIAIELSKVRTKGGMGPDKDRPVQPVRMKTIEFIRK